MSKRRQQKKQGSLLAYFSTQPTRLTEPSNVNHVENKIPEATVIIENMNNDDNRSMMEDSENEVDPLPRKIRKRQLIKEDDSSEEEEDILKHHKKKHIHIIESDEDINTQEKEDKQDFKEDLDFLDRTDILTERTRGKQVSRYTEALKKLKDRKGKLAQYDHVDKGPIESYTVIHSGSGSSGGEEEEDDNEEDFIVDDDIIDGEKVTAERVELPPEFSKGRTLSFRRQLETYILYLIELTLNPVFDISVNPNYVMAKEAVMRRIQSYRDSMVTSDVWLPTFKEAVDKYPHWSIARPYIIDDLVFCEACRSNKPATIQIKLTSDTLSTAEFFYLGSECCRKGEMYHQFNHFSSHMYKQVSELVRKNRSDCGESIKIFNKLVHSGDIKKLTNKVKAAFNDIVMMYNMKGQRTRIDIDSSSDSE